MTKSNLIERLCQDQKLPKGKAELLVNTIFDCLEQSLRRDERIEIRGFGSFEIRKYKPYEGRNPKTGVTVSVREKRLPFFKVGKELKERVNGPGGEPPDGEGDGEGDEDHAPRMSSDGGNGSSSASGSSAAERDSRESIEGAGTDQGLGASTVGRP